MTRGSTLVVAEPSDVASIVLDLSAHLQGQLRHELEGLDDDAVNWWPAPGANTIATHMLGSEAETLRSVAGATTVRHREKEFTRGRRPTAELFDELRAADELIVRLRTEISAERLGLSLALPTLPADERRPGLTWMVANYGHSREHVGHIQLTKQIFRARTAEPGDT